jgi:hypothetical protein
MFFYKISITYEEDVYTKYKKKKKKKGDKHNSK